MKTFKYLKYIIALGILAGVTFTSCDDENKKGDPPRLFRPIAALVNNNNTITASWDNILGAVSYELELQKATGELNEAGEDIFATYRIENADSSPYTFTNLDWDEKYRLLIKAVGENIESKNYETDDLSVVYLTSLTDTRTVDNAVLVQWKQEGNVITALRVMPDAGGDTIDVAVSAADYTNGEIVIAGLESETSYRVQAYSGDELTSNTYEGRLRFTTKAPENYDEVFGPGNWIDVRSETSETVLKDNFETLKQYEGIILQGGFTYNVSGDMAFESSMTFVTGQSLAGNAIFNQSSSFKCVDNAVVNKLKFEKIDFVTDVNVATQTEPSFGSKQLYGTPSSSSNSTINEFILKECTVTGYRAVIRLQKENETIKNISFDNCTFNGIGNQGLITSNNQGTVDIENITIKNSTLLNIVMLADLRATKTPPVFTITDCTFCYAPIETTANANTPLFRFASNPVQLSVNNTIFGPSMATADGAGSPVKTYNPGTKGSIMINPSGFSAGVVNSYKTNFDWTSINYTNEYPLEGLTALSVNETTLFDNPSEGNFTIRHNFEGAKTAGAIKWRME